MPSLIACAVLAAALPASFAENLSSMSSNRTVSAQYRQVREFKNLEVKLVVDGTMFYERGRGLVWATHSPVKTKTVISSSSLVQWSAGTGKTARLDLEEVPFAKTMQECQNAWFGGDLNAVKGFEVKSSDAASAELLAVDPAVKEIYPRMKVWFSKSPPSVSKVELYEKSGDKTTLSFYDVKNNVDLPSSTWECP